MIVHTIRPILWGNAVGRVVIWDDALKLRFKLPKEGTWYRLCFKLQAGLANETVKIYQDGYTDSESSRAYLDYIIFVGF